MTRAIPVLLAAAVGVGAVAAARARTGFDNTAPMAAQQWYLTQDRAWSYWAQQPALAPVKVAVIDSGIDAGHPEFAGKIAGGRSFVGGSWRTDTDGHGTFVAGLIAAGCHEICGLAFNARLLIAKVVQPSGVDVSAEVRAIRWAADAGARVINLSLGGTRDPQDPKLDTYSPVERRAVEYAWSKGALVVAASGNGPESPATPWRYADYPAALPHVLGVAALRENGSVPDYSNRDQVYVDLAAPGDDIFSTIPRNLVDRTLAGCAGVPYSSCGPAEFQKAIGTSFAAPQVSAAAALLLGVDPKLTNDQVEWLLERSARDVNPGDGCAFCPPGRDQYTGWGRLDVLAALRLLAAGKVPPPDPYEPNDDVEFAHPLGVPPATVRASLDYWDDPVDVYALRLRKGRRLFVRLSASAPGAVALTLWRPGTPTVLAPAADPADRLATGAEVGAQRRLSLVVPATGTYYLEASFLPPGRPRVTYSLSVAAA